MKINRLGFVAGLACLVSGCSESPEPRGLENTTYIEKTVENEVVEPVKPESVKQLPEHIKLDYGFREGDNFDKVLKTYSLDHLKDVLGEKYTNLTLEEKKRVEMASKGDKYYILTVCENYLESRLDPTNTDPEDDEIYKRFKVNGLSAERKKEYLEIYPWIKKEDFESLDNPARQDSNERELIYFSEGVYEIKRMDFDFGFNSKPGNLMDTILTFQSLIDFVSNRVRKSYNELRNNSKE